MSKRGPGTHKAPAPKKTKRLNARAALHDGSLLTGVAFAGLQVTLQLSAEYNQTTHYKALNKALYMLYQISPAFQASFEQPKNGTHAPVLRLKTNHGYADEQAILTALKGFAEPQKPLNARAALYDGSLLTSVTRTELQVTLQLTAEYTQVSHYKAINKALYELYRISPAFQARFEQPKIGLHAPVLRLKANHGYADEQAILMALKGFAAPPEKLKVKATLRNGSLLTGVALSGLKVTLQLSAEYTQVSHYKAINQALYNLYRISLAFQARFELPIQGTHVPVLRLKANHGYADESAILRALRGFAGSAIAAPLTIALHSSSDNLLALLSQQLADDKQPDSSETTNSPFEMQEFSLCAMPASELKGDATFSQPDNFILNSSSDDLLSLLRQQLSDNRQQHSFADPHAATSLQFEDIGSFLRLSGDVGLEVNEVDSTLPDTLEEVCKDDCRFGISR